MHENYLTDLSESAAEAISFEIHLKYTKLEQITWDLIEKAIDTKTKLRCVQILANLTSEKTELLMRLGVLKERQPSTFEDIFNEAFNELQRENMKKEKAESNKPGAMGDCNAGFSKA